MDGWIKMYRKTLNHPVAQSASFLGLWTYTLLRANHKDNDVLVNNTIVHLKRGEFLSSIQKMARELKINRMTLTRMFGVLVGEQMLSIKTTNKYTVITIQNYNQYQENDHQMSNKRASTEHQLSTNKNDKNEKNITKNSNTRKERDVDIDFILQTFEKHLGHKPTDKSPRNIAYVFKRQVTSFIAEIAPHRPGLEFRGLIEKSFDWYCQANEQVKGRTLDSIRRNVVNVLFDKTRRKYLMKGGVTP